MPVKTITKNPDAYAYPLLIKQLLHTPMQTAPDELIVYRGLTRHTYTDMRARIGKLANVLEALGIEAGSCVAMMDWDSHRYLETYFAVPMMGAILQTVNIRLSPQQISYTLDHAQAEVIIVHQDFLPLLEPLLQDLPQVRAVIVIADEPLELPAYAVGEFESLLATVEDNHAFPDFDENAIATRFYTTGTTGSPKAVSFTHRQLVTYTLATAAAFGCAPTRQHLGHGDVYMPITPMFHVHAWGLPFVATLLGLKQVYPGRYVAGELLALKAKEGVTFSHCVPTILQMLLDARGHHTPALTGWKIVIGGAALTPALAQRALDADIEVWAGGGMSETCASTYITRVSPDMTPAEALQARCTTGLPIPLVEIRVVDEQMGDLQRDGFTTGELVVRAPWLTESYAGDPEASQALWRGGYLHTQDIGHMSSTGYVQITDRLKDVIKSGGEWISSLHIEALVASIPGVLECAVVGIQDPRWGERPCALIVKEATADLTSGCIKARLSSVAERGQISRYAIPEEVHFLERLPKTSVGKTDKRAIRAWLEAETTPKV